MSDEHKTAAPSQDTLMTVDDTVNDTLAGTERPVKDYVTLEDLQKFQQSIETMVDERMAAFEKAVKQTITNVVDNAEFIRRGELKSTLGDYVTIDESKAMVETSKAGFREEVAPVTLQLTLLNSHLAKVIEIDGTVKSLTRDVEKLQTGHDTQQNLIATLEASSGEREKAIETLKVSSAATNSIALANQRALQEMLLIKPQVNAIAEVILEMKAERDRARERRRWLVDKVRAVLHSPKFWTVVTGVGAAVFEIARQSGFWDRLLEGFVPGG